MENTQVSTATEEQQNTEQMELQILSYLEDLLARQLEKLRKYDLDGAYQLAEESQKMAIQAADLGLLERPEYSQNKERIRGLYNDLCLVIASERQEVSDKLKQIREGIRVLSAYANNR